MITIDSPYLPTYTETENYSATVTEIVTGEDNYFAPLVSLDFGGSESVVIEYPEGAVSLPPEWQGVTSVIVNGATLTPATNPESPQMGEYRYNPYTNTIEVFLDRPVRSLVVSGEIRSIPVYPPLLAPPYPALFTNLPIEGTLQITRSFEDQPSATFEFETTLRKGQLQQIFAPGLEINLFGIPLRINNLNIKEFPRSIYPDARCKVSVSLGSKWENYLDEPCFLRADGANPITHPLFECTPDTGRNINLSTTVQNLLGKIGIRYTGPTLAGVPLPRDTPKDATVNPMQLLQDRVRVVNSFIRWSNSEAIEVVPINNLPIWIYNEWEILGEIDTSYDAIARSNKRPFTIPDLNPPPPDLENFPSTVQPYPVPTLTLSPPPALNFEYKNAELSGEFYDSAFEGDEQTQGSSKPRYTRKPVKRETRIDGDANAHIPPDGVVSIQVMSLCFDIGGDTKDRSYVTLEDGVEISVVNETWAFVFTAREIVNDATGNLLGNPIQYWKCIKQTRIDPVYDRDTGYKIYSYETGYVTNRFKQESAENPETLELTPEDEEYALYQFRQIPVYKPFSNVLKLMPEANIGDRVEWVTVCNRDGTSSLEAVINPDFVPPYYVEAERTESVAFASTANPDNENVDLYIGEESRFEASTQVTEAVYQEKLVGFENGYPVYERGEEITPAKFVRYIKQFKAQGPQIAEAVEQSSIEEGSGMPPAVPVRPARYVREDPSPRDKTDLDKPQYRYFLRTDGYTESDPVNGSESFPLAKDFDEALTAAKCRAAIENWRSGLQESLSIPGNLGIKEGDRFNYTCNGELRQRVVISLTHIFDIQGVINGSPRVTHITNLSLGSWVLPNVDFSKVLVPKQNLTGSDIFVTKDRIGQILPYSRVRSRRNPQAEE